MLNNNLRIKRWTLSAILFMPMLIFILLTLLSSCKISRPYEDKIQDIQLSTERLSSGIKGFDKILGRKSFYQGSSILVSGFSGTGKTSFAASIVHAFCRNEKRCLFCAFERQRKVMEAEVKRLKMPFESAKEELNKTQDEERILATYIKNKHTP